MRSSLVELEVTLVKAKKRETHGVPFENNVLAEPVGFSVTCNYVPSAKARCSNEGKSPRDFWLLANDHG